MKEAKFAYSTAISVNVQLTWFQRQQVFVCVQEVMIVENNCMHKQTR
jgi:hypothetical protein